MALLLFPKTIFSQQNLPWRFKKLQIPDSVVFKKIYFSVSPSTIEKICQRHSSGGVLAEFIKIHMKNPVPESLF